jgi:hypothetical protein
MRNHRIGPPGHGLISVPIREYCVTWPHGSNILSAVRIVQEHTTIIAVSVDAVVVAGIVGVGDVNSRINDAVVMLGLRLMRGLLLATHGI